MIAESCCLATYLQCSNCKALGAVGGYKAELCQQCHCLLLPVHISRKVCSVTYHWPTFGTGLRFCNLVTFSPPLSCYYMFYQNSTEWTEIIIASAANSFFSNSPREMKVQIVPLSVKQALWRLFCLKYKKSHLPWILQKIAPGSYNLLILLCFLSTKHQEGKLWNNSVTIRVKPST